MDYTITKVVKADKSLLIRQGWYCVSFTVPEAPKDIRTKYLPARDELDAYVQFRKRWDDLL
jgi:hypothetical protein